MLLEAASTDFPRVETLITESTYGGPNDLMPSRIQAEEGLASIINETLERKGKVLIPVPAVGRAQEIMLVIDDYMRRGLIREAPVFIEGMILEATSIHTAYPEYLSRNCRRSILHDGINPFESDYFTLVKHPSGRADIIEGEPCIIMATSGMLEGGPVIEYFKRFAEDQKNSLIFVSYQIKGTLGRRIQKGLPEVEISDSEGKKVIVNVKLQVNTIGGFSGHSDRHQIIQYLNRLRSNLERVVICHGEKTKTISLANFLNRRRRIKTLIPLCLETFKLF
jgi:predicted metal-dependent RNase